MSMKPDQTNPGEFEATQDPAVEAPELQKSVPEQVADRAGELPQQTAVVPTADDATQSQQGAMPRGQSVTTQSQATVTAKEQFEAELAKIPAEDVDTIEKEWVEKADEIVEKTKDDPYAENEVQHSLSRAYLKKRFNLDVD